MADKEEIKTLEELEEKGRILREYKEKFRQMCQENKMIKGSTVLKLYDKIEEIQREYEHLDNKLTLMCKLCSNGMPVPLLRNGYSIFNGTKYR